MLRKRKSGKAVEAVQLRCAVCGHAESDHGRSGSRPCMAVVGDLGKREFCACDEFHGKASLAA